MNIFKKIVLSIVPCMVLALLASCTNKAGEGGNSSGLEADLVFPASLASTIPSDVDTALNNKYIRENQIAKAQRLHDIFSWQSFLAINWPVDAKGNPQPKITDPGNPLWNGWSEAFQVFRDSGQAPLPWGTPQAATGWLTKALASKNMASADGKHRILFRNNKMLPVAKTKTVANEVDQAFTGPMYDQNGNLVRYEVLMNKSEYDYIVSNKIYNLDGQVAFSSTNDSLANFPSGIFRNQDSVGAIEIKLAWKVLDAKKDIASRFFSVDAYVMNTDNTWSDVKVGLVGMHISHKCKSGKQWIWSTFEQVDNLSVNELEVFEHDGIKQNLRPSFYDPDCPTCPVNVFQDSLQIPYTLPSGFMKPPNYPQLEIAFSIPKEKYIPNGNGAFIAQAQRVIPIPKATQELNHQVQQMLKEQGSVWQYYELVGTQWPKHPDVKPAANTYANLPASVMNKPGGDPQPVFLTNLTMETYFQTGNQSASGMIENANPPVQSGQERYVFGTESCMGCHSSAGITIGKDKTGNAVTAGQLSADFSWLLQTQAKWKQ